jgi:hypothetical protein
VLVEDGVRPLLAYKVVPLVVAVALLAALPLSTCATRSTDRCRAAPAPTVALPRQRHAAQVALRMPLVRRLLARRRLNGTLLDVQANRQGALIGVRVRLTLQRPVERVDATWPWLLIDNSGTLHPPYQIIRMHVQPRLLWGVGVTVLAPAYTTAVVSSWTAVDGSRTPVAGQHDRRPRQPDCA